MIDECGYGGQPPFSLYENENGKWVDEVETNRDRFFALCSTADEILGLSHLRLLSPILSPEHLV